MPYTDQGLPHAGSAEVLFTGMFDEPAGTIARTIPRSVITGSGSAVLTSTVYVRSIPLPAGLVATNLAFHIGTTAEAGGSHGWYALLDANLNVLAVTADQTGATFFAASTFTPLPLASRFVVPQTGLYYAALCITATTMPTVGSGANIAAGLSVNPAPSMAGTAGAGTTPPTVGTQVNGGAIAGAGFNLGAWVS
jgi:hypothetical protein